MVPWCRAWTSKWMAASEVWSHLTSCSDPLSSSTSTVSPQKCSYCYQDIITQCFVHHWLPALLHPEALPRLPSFLFCHWFILPPEKFSASSQYKIINLIIVLGLQHVPCWIFWQTEAARHFHLGRHGEWAEIITSWGTKKKVSIQN